MKFAAALALAMTITNASEQYGKRSVYKVADELKGGLLKGSLGNDSYDDNDSYGKDSYGNDSYGKDSYGKDSYGKDSYGKDSYGNDSYGNDSYGNDSYGNDSYGNDNYGNDNYGNDNYGNDSYGNNSYGNDSYGQADSYGHDDNSYGGHGGHGDSYSSSYVPSETVYAKCMLKDPEEEAYLGGTINFSQDPYGKTTIWGDIWGVEPGNHGFHVHELGDLRKGCASTAGHWNPDGTDHGAAHDHAHHHHAGDLAQAYADKNGDAIIEQGDTQLDLYGDKSIIGRSLVIHKKKDDLGRGGDAGSVASGNSGPRIGCCTIGLVAGPKNSYGKGRNY